MDACLISILIFIIVIVTVLILILIVGRRPKFLCNIPNRNLYPYKHDIMNRLRSRNYETAEKPNGNIFIKKDFFTETTLVFKQNGPNIEVSFIHSNSNAFLAVFIVLFLFIWIIAIVLAIIADSNSKEFRNNELKPLLIGYGTDIKCPNCSRDIPMDGNICPYCGVKL